VLGSGERSHGDTSTGDAYVGDERMTTSRDARMSEKAETMAESHDASHTERHLSNLGAHPRLSGDSGEGVISAAMAVCR
jgi:hypothetical protein